MLCDDCLADFRPVSPATCSVCGGVTSHPKVCPRCRQTPWVIDGIRSAVYLEDGARKAIHRFKYGNLPSLATSLANVMVEHWLSSPLPADLVVSVPLHIARQRERGYNQADLLARTFAQNVGLPVARGVLKRVRHTRAQVGLSAAHRLANVHGAFQCELPRQNRSGETLNLEGQRILIIDDVCTTGATLEACSVALKAVGADHIWGLTLACAV
jgi:ComF family protein